jgi:hypothetical protein
LYCDFTNHHLTRSSSLFQLKPTAYGTVTPGSRLSRI